MVGGTRMTYEKEWRLAQGDAAVAILVSAVHLNRHAQQMESPPELLRQIQKHQELTRLAIAEIVGEDWFRRDIVPLVAALIEEIE